MRVGSDDGLSLHFKHKAEHTMCSRVLRAKVDLEILDGGLLRVPFGLSNWMPSRRAERSSTGLTALMCASVILSPATRLRVS